MTDAHRWDAPSRRTSETAQRLIGEAMALARADLQLQHTGHAREVVDLLRAAVQVTIAEFGADAIELAYPLLLKARALGNLAEPAALDEAVLAYHRGITVVEEAGLEWDQETLIAELRSLARLVAERPSDLPQAEEMLERLAGLLRT